MIHHVQVFQGAVRRTIAIDPAAGVDDTLVRAYTRGQCVALAIALHRRTDWPIVLTCTDPGRTRAHMGPGDHLGVIDEHDITYPGAHHSYPGNIAVRSHFMHALVLSPDGGVDIEGRAPLSHWSPNQEWRGRPAACACPAGCVCRQECCAGSDQMFFAYVSEQTALDLDQPLRVNGTRWGARAVRQNLQAADDVAEIVLAGLGAQPIPTRTTRPVALTR